MDKKTLKLLAGMPQELLTAWEKKHPEKWSIRYIAENYTKGKYLAFGLFLIWAMLAIVAGMEIDRVANLHGQWEGAVALGSIILAFVGAHLADKFVSHETVWDAILQPLETAMRDPALDLVHYFHRGYDQKYIAEGANISLVQSAQDVIVAEERFIHVRREPAILELGVISAAHKSIEYKNVFNKTLARAVEFGLSDGNRRQYFEEAYRKNKGTLYLS